MSLLNQFISFILKENLFSPKDKLLLAVSGGVDSVVLCELCNKAGFDFTIAHCNFQLRGAESERDEAFVRELAQHYKKHLLVKKFDTEAHALKNRVSIQVAARELRYEWFFEIIGNKQLAIGNEKPVVSSNNYEEISNSKLKIQNSQLSTPDSGLPTPDYLLTAHHLDDNIETLLMNFFKGTGVAGLRAMLPKQGVLVRPLLFSKKEEIKTFSEENNLKWVEDSSNESDKYSRNYFRHQLVPLVQKIYPSAMDNLADNLNRFKQMELLYRQAIDMHKKKLLEYKGNEVHIPVLKLKKTVPLESVVYEIIKDFDFSPAQVNELTGLLHSESGKYISSATHRIIKNRNWLIIAPLQASETAHVLIDSFNDCPFADGTLKFKQMPASQHNISVLNTIATLDIATIQFPLLLRKWKQGDYFYPLGMRKKKKLSRFFIDQKLSKTDKEKVWVLEMNKKIVWVVGYRIDDRFKITDNTKEVLTITLMLNTT
jgi:tRNA(Ile)-lysidine synthase